MHYKIQPHIDHVAGAVFRPRSSRSCGGPQTLGGATREWKKFRLELKRAIPGYATDVFGNVFVMLFTSC